MVTVSPANKTAKVAAEAKKQNEEVKKQISDTNKDVPAFSNVEKSEIVRSETEKVTEKKINRKRVEEKREVAATNEITCGKIKPKKNRASKLSIIFGIVTWILLFSVVGAAFSLITVIIGVVFGFKGLFSKEKGKSVIGLIINGLYFAVIIMML